MEVYKGTGKTKTGELRISRAIGALLITSSRKLKDLTNERITVYIERANGGNIELATNINLKHFILGSTFGSTVIKGDTDSTIGLSALCEIGIMGSIELEPNESIKVSMDGLISSETYTINGIEYPQSASGVVTAERKTMLSDEIEKSYSVSGAELMMVDSDKLLSVEFTFSNNVRIKYTIEEVLALAFDVENIITANTDGTIDLSTGGVLMFPLDDVFEVEFTKTTGTVEMTLLRG